MAAGGDDDHVRALHRRGEVRRDQVELREAVAHRTGLDAARRAQLGQFRIVDVVEPHLVAGGADMRDQIEAAIAGPDDGDRLCVGHFLPVLL